MLHSYSARHNLGYSAQNKPKKTYKTKGVDFHMEYVRAFVIGGAICVIGQLLIDLTKLTPARIMVAYVTGGVILGALGWYAPLVNFAGCGATVPLSGFGYLLSEGVKAAVKNKRRRVSVLCGACSWFEKGILSDSTHPFFILFVHSASLKPTRTNLSFVLLIHFTLP